MRPLVVVAFAVVGLLVVGLLPLAVAQGAVVLWQFLLLRLFATLQQFGVRRLLNESVVGQLSGAENTLTNILGVVLHSLVEILAEEDRFRASWHYLAIVVAEDWVELFRTDAIFFNNVLWGTIPFHPTMKFPCDNLMRVTVTDEGAVTQIRLLFRGGHGRGVPCA